MERRERLRRSIEGMAQLVVAMALCIFLPAWTVRYWQAWLLLAVFFGCTIAITVDLYRRDPALLERRLHAGPAAEKEASQRIIQALASLVFLAVLVVPALDHRFGWTPLPPAAALAGDALVALGFWIVWRVFRENTFTSGAIEVDASQRVIDTGPYAIVRHPMYVGGLLLFLGMPLALGSGVGLLVFVPALFAIVWRLLDEERFLVSNLPGYADYRQRTRYRLLPFLW